MYSISGPDAGSFALNETTGTLTFRAASNVDSPGSVDNDNFYFINVTVKDPSSGSDTKLVIIEVSRYDPSGPFTFTDGAVYLGPNSITSSDPSILQSVIFDTTDTRIVPDNRFPGDTQTDVYIFDALYENSKQFKMVVNTQITPFSEAERQAQLYAKILGQLNPILIEGIQFVFIHPGNANFTGPVGSIVAHTGTAEKDLIPIGALEEVMAHEAIHASIQFYSSSIEWYRAQRSDVAFISQYARDFAETEDLAESYGAYLILKNATRNPLTIVQKIREEIPARMQFFERLGL